jgi:hypothetical protein
VTSYRFPDSGTRNCIRQNGDQAQNGIISYYLDSSGTNAAPIFVDRGNRTPASSDSIASSKSQLDAHGSQMNFRGPTDGTRVIYASVDGGPIFPVPCDPLDVIDAMTETITLLTARVTALETGTGGGGGGGGGGTTDSPFFVDGTTGKLMIDITKPGVTRDPATGRITVDVDVVTNAQYDADTGALKVTIP